MPDDALLAGFGVGDPAATASFVRRYQASVFGLAQSVVNDRALAEDVAQEVFLRAWRHATSYDPRKGSLATWLLSITRGTPRSVRVVNTEKELLYEVFPSVPSAPDRG